MLSLLIDTSTEQGIVVLAKAGHVVWEEKLPIGLHNSRFVMPAVAKGFRELSLDIDDLEYVAAGVGPGSYTGIRVAAAVAETIAYVRHTPLVGITTLAGFGSKREEPHAVLLDAKIGGVYLFVEGHAPTVVPIEELVTQLEGVTTLVTPHYKALKLKIENQYPDMKWVWCEAAISSKRLAFHAHKKYLNGEYSTEAQLELLYLRKTQAEIDNSR